MTPSDLSNRCKEAYEAMQPAMKEYRENQATLEASIVGDRWTDEEMRELETRAVGGSVATSLMLGTYATVRPRHCLPCPYQRRLS